MVTGIINSFSERIKKILWETYYGNNFDSFILNRVKICYWIWDCFTAGEKRYHYFVLQDGKDQLLTITHEWWLSFEEYSNEPSWKEEYRCDIVKNEFFYEYTTSPEEIKVNK